MLQSSLSFIIMSSVLMELVVGLCGGITASSGKTAAAKFTVGNMDIPSSLLLDGVVDMLPSFLTLTMMSSALLELLVGLCGGITASSEKMMDIASLFLDAVVAVSVIFF